MPRFLFVAALALFAFPTAAQTTSLTGTLYNAAGDPLPGAQIQLLDNSNYNPRIVEDSTQVTESGSFAFDIERTGRLLLRVVHDDATLGETSIFTDESTTIGIDLMLESSDTEPDPLTLRFHSPDGRPAHFAKLLGLPGAAGAAEPNIQDEAYEHAKSLRRTAEQIAGSSLSSDSAAAVLATVPADSPLWIAGGDRHLVLRVVDATEEPEAYADYLDRYVMEQEDGSALPSVLFELLNRARRAEDPERITRLLDRVQDGLADTFWGSRALAEFGPERNIRIGEPVPPFALPLHPGGTATVSRGDLSGQVLLLDFWATWCLPCLAERDDLARLYETYSGRGFEIISVSLDFERKDLEEGLERWPMPWRHAYLPPDAEVTERTMSTFDLGSLPKLVLVDRDGKVVGGGSGFKPEDAEAALEVLFD